MVRTLFYNTDKIKMIVLEVFKKGGKLKNMIGIACDVVCMREREVFSSNWPEFAFKLSVDAMIKRAHM